MRSMTSGGMIDDCAKSFLPCASKWSASASVGKILLSAGVPCSINTDDPAMFGTSLVHEWDVLHRNLRLTRQEVLRVGRNTLEACFLKEDEKKVLLSEFDRSAERHAS